MLGPLLASAAIVLLIDQATKQLVWGRRRDLVLSRTLRVRIRPVLVPRVARWPLVTGLVMTAAVIVATIAYGPLFPHVVAHVGLGGAIGGATGNVVDRLWRGGVVDFIDLGWWPVFNGADVAITAGILTALWFVW